MSEETLRQIESRFVKAVDLAFSFLEIELGFLRCGLQEVDLRDIRDARIHCRYTRDSLQIEVSLELGILQPSVYLRQFTRRSPLRSR